MLRRGAGLLGGLGDFPVDLLDQLLLPRSLRLVSAVLQPGQPRRRVVQFEDLRGLPGPGLQRGPVRVPDRILVRRVSLRRSAARWSSRARPRDGGGSWSCSARRWLRVTILLLPAAFRWELSLRSGWALAAGHLRARAAPATSGSLGVLVVGAPASREGDGGGREGRGEGARERVPAVGRDPQTHARREGEHGTHEEHHGDACGVQGAVSGSSVHGALHALRHGLQRLDAPAAWGGGVREHRKQRLIW
mmetsp:Transcript_75736/g.225796  ORF Transcript_75736/g.225796 Transcript_75736/m.225796 type:complete len:248 (+) Transcript_75736:601-1344(+)